MGFTDKDWGPGPTTSERKEYGRRYSILTTVW
jgi:hypothetical protein